MISIGKMLNFKTYSYPYSEVLPSVEDMMDYLHLEDTDHPGYAFICSTLPKLAEAGYAVGGYSVFQIEQLDIKNGQLRLSGHSEELQPGHQVCAYLRGCSEAAFFLCTAGALFSRESHRFNAQGDLLEAYLIDAIGSLTVENAMDRIHSALEEEMQSQGINITNRYSPGYCNWPITDQRSLFSLIGPNPTGIQLGDSCLMTPIKSVSGVIGLGKEAKKRPYGCAICKNTTCIYRRLISG